MSLKFFKDLARGQKAEKLVLEILLDRYPNIAQYKFNDTWEYDIALKSQSGIVTYFEVKEDTRSKYTDNVAVEFECFGKPSGPFKTKADFFVYVITRLDGYYFVRLDPNKLREACIAQKKSRGTVTNHKSKGKAKLVLFPWEEFIKTPYTKILEKRDTKNGNKQA